MDPAAAYTIELKDAGSPKVADDMLREWRGRNVLKPDPSPKIPFSTLVAEARAEHELLIKSMYVYTDADAYGFDTYWTLNGYVVPLARLRPVSIEAQYHYIPKRATIEDVHIYSKSTHWRFPSETDLIWLSFIDRVWSC